jgi:hypothetical protein
MVSSLPREGTFAQPWRAVKGQRSAVDANCHTLVSQLKQNTLDLRRALMGTFA